MIELPTFIYEIKEEPDAAICGNLILIDDDDNVVSLPMSQTGLLEMASKLVRLAIDMGTMGKPGPGARE